MDLKKGKKLILIIFVQDLQMYVSITIIVSFFRLRVELFMLFINMSKRWFYEYLLTPHSQMFSMLFYFFYWCLRLTREYFTYTSVASNIMGGNRAVSERNSRPESKSAWYGLTNSLVLALRHSETSGGLVQMWTAVYFTYMHENVCWADKLSICRSIFWWQMTTLSGEMISGRVRS